MGIEGIWAFLLGFPILIIIEIIRYINKKSLNRNFEIDKELSIIIFSIYIMGLISVTLFPLNIGTTIYEPTVNIIPVFTIIDDMSRIPLNMEGFMIKFWIINIVGNLLLLAPLATIVPIIFKKFRNIKSTLILCFLVSLLIEFLQYLSTFIGSIRSVDIDDLILNTLGSLIGFSVFKIIQRKLPYFP